MRLNTQCCKSCQKRHIGCHSECEEYKAAKAELERIKEQMRKQAETDGYFVIAARKKKKKFMEQKKK